MQSHSINIEIPPKRIKYKLSAKVYWLCTKRSKLLKVRDSKSLDIFKSKLDVTKTGNGEWGMGNGEWGMGN